MAHLDYWIADTHAVGFTPFGKLSPESMQVIDKVNAAAGEQPDQDDIYRQGNGESRW
jgi:hypothetical protein